MSTTEMTPEEKFSLARSIGAECIQDEELLNLFKNKKEIIAYDGFEPSGRMHIAQGILKSINVNKLTKCGVKFVFWVADWFALLNHKMGGDLEKIKNVGRYFIHVWQACGMDMEHVEFLWSSEEILKRPNEYWSLVFDIATKNTVTRVIRCSQIMGRSESESMEASQVFYPVMQCADVFFLKADICQLGMDQRKVNMLAREYCDSAKIKHKPVILSHPMLMGLLEGQEKMSKSVPGSAIFLEDTEQEVNAKIKKSFCPPKQVDGNPIMDYFKHIVFQKQSLVMIPANEKFGTPEKVFNNFEQMAAAYLNDEIHPGDLKNTLAKLLNVYIQPVRDHFENNEEAKELLKLVRSYSVTR